MKKWIMWWAAGCLVLFSLPGCTSPVYFAESMEAWVVDAETGEPIEGVVVVANWQLVVGSLDGPRPRGQLNILETVTDKNGRFYFPAWGPKLALASHLRHEDPALLFFKSGYFPSGESNDVTTEPNPSIIRRSEWNGKKIPLKKHKGDWEALERVHMALASALSFAIYGEDCEWKLIPKMFVAIENEKRGLIRKKIPGAPFLTGLDIIPEGKKCGSVHEFFKDYLK